MARKRSKFSRDALVGGHVLALAPDPIYVETAGERARSTFKETVLHSFWHLIWIAVCGIIAAAIVAALTVTSTDAVVAGAITLIGGLAGLAVGLGTSFIQVWAFAPRAQRDELRQRLFDVQGRYDDLIAEIQRPAELFADVRMEVSPNDRKPLLRIGLRNDGNQPLPAGTLLNIIYPAAWTTFEGCTSEGLYLIGGPSLVSDEDLPGDVSARLWALELDRPLVGGGRTHLLYWRVRGPAGRYQFFVRIWKLNELVTVELPEN